MDTEFLAHAARSMLISSHAPLVAFSPLCTGTRCHFSSSPRRDVRAPAWQQPLARLTRCYVLVYHHTTMTFHSLRRAAPQGCLTPGSLCLTGVGGHHPSPAHDLSNHPLPTVISSRGSSVSFIQCQERDVDDTLYTSSQT